MRKFEFLSPAARATLRYIKSVEVRSDDEFEVPAIVMALRKQGQPIGVTLSALNECRTNLWLSARRQPDGPDRVALTTTASVALALQPAE